MVLKCWNYSESYPLFWHQLEDTMRCFLIGNSIMISAIQCNSHEFTYYLNFFETFTFRFSWLAKKVRIAKLVWYSLRKWFSHFNYVKQKNKTILCLVLFWVELCLHISLAIVTIPLVRSCFSLEYSYKSRRRSSSTNTACFCSNEHHLPCEICALHCVCLFNQNPNLFLTILNLLRLFFSTFCYSNLLLLFSAVFRIHFSIHLNATDATSSVAESKCEFHFYSVRTPKFSSVWCWHDFFFALWIRLFHMLHSICTTYCMHRHWAKNLNFFVLSTFLSWLFASLSNIWTFFSTWKFLRWA